jgi:hypothetical protein
LNALIELLGFFGAGAKGFIKIQSPVVRYIFAFFENKKAKDAATTGAMDQHGFVFGKIVKK